ncbi:MAG: deoxyribodipyrimidine photo-lyase [Ignavibacteriales bacterium]|nr:deoxyribodipyrimidine photo-lyase [Ignavibacteriales bacterium]
MNLNRVGKLNNCEIKKSPIVYWLSREHRVDYNWAILFGLELAKSLNTILIIVFNLVPSFLNATLRQYSFMLKGLKEVHSELSNLNIPFFITTGQPENNVTHFLSDVKAGALLTDFDPLKIKMQWKNNILKVLKIPFYEVDSHNIVPCWLASNKQEFGAYTIRPKIKKILDEYLDDFPKLKKQNTSIDLPEFALEKLFNKIEVDNDVKEIDWLKPGADKAKKVLRRFIKEKLDKYQSDRNDPNKDAISNLSPYLHFGQISSQYIAKEILKSDTSSEAKESFLEELIVRKELSDNFCYYNRNYDNFDGFPQWAKNTLQEHLKDKREFEYSLKEFEKAKTHDELWNSAQNEMVLTGKMHGYMRMYWAKKILEWSASPQEAMNIAIYLNDKYQLDGRDPNGYAGIAWSIGGMHDRAWSERNIFGKVRYMNYNGCKRKFDVEEYSDKWSDNYSKT